MGILKFTIKSNVLFTTIFLTCVFLTNAQYLPTWDSLDKRPLPQWYDDAKVGIFLHWGVFSVPSYRSEWFWYYWQAQNESDIVQFMQQYYPPGYTYADFASDFSASWFDPDDWADLFQAAGARYVVLTSKHHEGFCNWPTKYSFNWNSMDVGPRRDLVGDLANSIRKRTDIKFGLYHSLYEWFNPMYNLDVSNNYQTQYFPKGKSMPELYELVTNYKPEVIWSDGAGGPDTYWNSTEFIAWLYNESPVKDTVVTNDRWGSNNILCNHGDFYTCDDRYNPGTLQPHKWENAMSLDRYAWGFRRNARLDEYLLIEELIITLVQTVSCGGNILINIGPTREGRIVPFFQERLLQLGEWLSVNGEAIYESRPWKYQNDTINQNIWYTKKNDAVYAMLIFWASVDNTVTLGAPIPTDSTVITMLGNKQPVSWTKYSSSSGIVIDQSQFEPGTLPCRWAWVFKMTNLAN